MNELTRYFIQECKDIQDWKARVKANQIEMDNWFKYSGQVEEDEENYKHLMKEAREIKAARLAPKCRKEYFKKYWLQNKYKQVYLKEVKKEKLHEKQIKESEPKRSCKQLG